MKKLVRFIVIALLSTSFLGGFESHVFAASNGACTTPTTTSLTETGTTYTVQTFTTVESNCTWTIPAAVTSIEVLVVGGGGGAGFGACGGGGGAGRLIDTNSPLAVSPGGSVSMTIGNGGAGGWYSSSDWRTGTSGSASSFVLGGSTYSASGGGGGAGNSTAAGLTGGSGGGGTGCTTASGGAPDASAISGFTGFAFAGGTGNSTGGGGGGAGGAGGLGTGGAGKTIWGVTLAGGGGGWGGGAGGSGGGGSALSGTATKAASGNPGTAGTGSGGGGGNDGGSGRVMIRYVVDTFAPTFTSSASFSTPENVSSSTNVATIKVSESATIVISAGVDSATFSIVTSDSITALIRFKTPPDYEAPTDSGANNVYDITIRATDTFGNAGTQAITITVTNLNESSTINAPTISGAIYKGSTTTITITMNVAGKVRFAVGKNRISTCLAVSTTGSYPNFSATCSWKPPVTGNQTLTATLTPTDGTFSAATSNPTTVYVVKRGNTR
jgi:hypothetical protein